MKRRINYFTVVYFILLSYIACGQQSENIETIGESKPLGDIKTSELMYTATNTDKTFLSKTNYVTIDNIKYYLYENPTLPLGSGIPFDPSDIGITTNAVGQIESVEFENGTLTATNESNKIYFNDSRILTTDDSFVASLNGKTETVTITNGDNIEIDNTNENEIKINAIIPPLNYVPLIEDVNSNMTAASIGTRDANAIVGVNSFTVGENNIASETNTIASGKNANATNELSYVWSGMTNNKHYGSHGVGTYNINPVDGLSGFYIGETNLQEILDNLQPVPPEPRDFGDGLMIYYNTELCTNGSTIQVTTNYVNQFFDVNGASECGTITLLLPEGNEYKYDNLNLYLRESPTNGLFYDIGETNFCMTTYPKDKVWMTNNVNDSIWKFNLESYPGTTDWMLMDYVQRVVPNYNTNIENLSRSAYYSNNIIDDTIIYYSGVDITNTEYSIIANIKNQYYDIDDKLNEFTNIVLSLPESDTNHCERLNVFVHQSPVRNFYYDIDETNIYASTYPTNKEWLTCTNEAIWKFEFESYPDCTDWMLMKFIIRQIPEYVEPIIGDTIIVYNDERGTVTTNITEIAANEFRENTNIESIVIGGNVTSIGNLAFSFCTNLTNATIGPNVTNINENAFRGCNSVEIYNVSHDNEYYSSINNMLLNKDGTTLIQGISGDVIIPDSVISINNSAFYGLGKNNKNNEIIIPENVCNIGNSAFSNTEGITNIVIGNGVTNIGSSVFAESHSLQSLTIGSGITNIPESMCVSCWNLSSINMPNNIKLIERYAFNGCFGLTNIVIGNGVTSIGEMAFSHCYGLASVTIGNSVTNIDPSAFHQSYSLDSVYINNLQSWCNISFKDAQSNPLYYANHLYLNNVEITGDLVIPNNTKKIAKTAFYRLGNLTSVSIPSSINQIGNDAFYNCTGLTNVYISNITSWCETSFGNESANPMYYARTFYLNNEEIKDLVISNSLWNVPKLAFINCNNLTSLSLLGKTDWVNGSKAFYGCSNLTNIVVSKDVKGFSSDTFGECNNMTNGSMIMLDRDLSTVQSMSYRYWGLPSGCTIVCTDENIIVP